MSRIVLIHQSFVAPEEAGITRHFELARFCVQAGHEFSIVASDVSYLTGEPLRRNGHIENWDGVRVLRAHAPARIHRSFVWRVLAFFAFMLPSIRAALRAGPVDLVIGTSPNMFQAFSAWVVSAIRRKPFLLEIRDLWPEFAIDLGILRSRILIALSRWLERFLYRRATHILVNSPAYIDYLVSKGVPRGKITLIPNGVLHELFNPERRGERAREQFGLEGKFVVVYAGALGIPHDIHTILKAAELLRDDEDVHFLIVGDGNQRPALEAAAAQMKLANVTFVGARPKLEMPEFLAAADACVAILRNIPMFRITYPTKVFDYMAAGRPTILAIDGIIRKVMEEAGGGVFVPPGDPEALATAVRELKRDPEARRRMGAAARRHVVANFSRREQGADFVRLIERLVRATAASPVHDEAPTPSERGAR